MGSREDDLRAVVEAVVDPRIRQPLGALGMLREVRASRRSAEVSIAVPADYSHGPQLAAAVGAAAERSGLPVPDVSLLVMTEHERSDLAARLHELGRPSAARGAVAATEEGSVKGPGRTNPFMEKSSKTRVLGINSGKGGVGKSSLTVNLAVALASLGHEVGLLDADVYGFSVPKMLGIESRPMIIDDLLVPPVVHGVRCISMGLFVDDDQPVVWRGPLLHKALEQFLVDVYWGGPDFLLVDMPPGTGDVALSMAQYLPRTELYVVTTPQPSAQRVAQRSAVMARQLKLPLRGVVENMSWFVADDGKRYELFGAGGGQELARSLGVALLGQIPFVPAVRQGGDDGVPIVVSDPSSAASAAFFGLANSIAALGPARVYRSELSVR